MINLGLPVQKFLKDVEVIRETKPPVSIQAPYRPPSKKIIGGGSTTPVKVTTPIKEDRSAVLTDLALMPFGLFGQAAVIGRGLTNDGPMTPVQFGATQAAYLSGLPGCLAGVEGVLHAQREGVQGVAPPGVQIFPPMITNIFEGKGVGEILPAFPDLSGLTKYLIPAAIGIAGVYLAGKFIK